jgi:hypothetical protein
MWIILCAKEGTNDGRNALRQSGLGHGMSDHKRTEDTGGL